MFGRLILINLSTLEHVYLSTAWSYSKRQNPYTNVGGPVNDVQRAAFTTKGCHPDLKIHVGTTARIDQFESTYGTNDPNSNYYSTDSSTFFLRYFDAGHRFVV